METLDLKSGENETAPNLILFKAVMDDTDYHDDENGKYYVQASYDLRNNSAKCQAPSDSSLCLLEIDEKSGEIVESTYTNFTAYKFNQASVSTDVMSFVEGAFGQCYQNATESSYSFARVNLITAEATFESCVDTLIVMDEWISSFSPDDSQFATASGNTESGQGQLLVVDTATGKTVLNADINKIGTMLGKVSGLVFSVIGELYLKLSFESITLARWCSFICQLRDLRIIQVLILALLFAG